MFFSEYFTYWLSWLVGHVLEMLRAHIKFNFVFEFSTVNRKICHASYQLPATSISPPDSHAPALDSYACGKKFCVCFAAAFLRVLPKSFGSVSLKFLLRAFWRRVRKRKCATAVEEPAERRKQNRKTSRIRSILLCAIHFDSGNTLGTSLHSRSDTLAIPVQSSINWLASCLPAACCFSFNYSYSSWLLALCTLISKRKRFDVLKLF